MIHIRKAREAVTSTASLHQKEEEQARDWIPGKHLGKKHGNRKQSRTEGGVGDDHEQSGTDQNNELHRTGP